MEKENKATKDTRREHAGCTILLFKFYCPLFQQCTPEVGAASARGMQEKRQLNAFIAVAAALTLGVGLFIGSRRFWNRRDAGVATEEALADNKKRRRSMQDLTEAQKRQRPVSKS